LRAYESAVLAASVEQAPTYLENTLSFDELVMDAPKDSKWWSYGDKAGNTSGDKVAEATYMASAQGKMGKFLAAQTLGTKYVLTPAANSEWGNCFFHTAVAAATTAAGQMVPQFMKSGCKSDGSPL